MEHFMIPCDFGGRKAPFPIYVGEPKPDSHPLHYQSWWLNSERGGSIPQEVMDSFEKLHKIAIENNVSFAELCVYAMGEALGSQEAQPAMPAPEPQHQPAITHPSSAPQTQGYAPEYAPSEYAPEYAPVAQPVPPAPQQPHTHTAPQAPYAAPHPATGAAQPQAPVLSQPVQQPYSGFAPQPAAAPQTEAYSNFQSPAAAQPATPQHAGAAHPQPHSPQGFTPAPRPAQPQQPQPQASYQERVETTEQSTDPYRGNQS